jgi:hypothetical protein
MSYYETISTLIRTVPNTIIDWTIERKRGKPPTQAFSEFLTNRLAMWPNLGVEVTFL